MEQKSKTLVLISIVILCIGVGLWLNKPEQSKSDQGLGSRTVKTSKYLGSSATTSPTYLTAGSATTSLAFASNDAESIDLNLIATASSSSATLQYTIEFSNSVNCPDGNADWFPEDGYTNTSNTLVTHGNGARLHSWNLATSTNAVASNFTRKNLSITPVASACTRINFSLSGANSSLWAEAVLAEPLE